MSTQRYKDGILRKFWDDDTRTYTEWDDQGQQIDSRPYTSEENAAADVRAIAEAEESNEVTISTKLIDDLAAMQAIIDQTNADLRTDPSREIKDLARATRRLIRRVERLLDGVD